MEIIRKYGVVIGIVAVVLILVILRSAGDNFRPDAAKWAQSSYSGENLVTLEDLPGIDGVPLVVRLDEKAGEFQIEGAENLIVVPASILDKPNLNIIKKHDGPVLLASGDQAVSAGIWMILSQMGIKNIFILSTNNDEAVKNEFRPDTLTRPEL